LDEERPRRRRPLFRGREGGRTGDYAVGKKNYGEWLPAEKCSLAASCFQQTKIKGLAYVSPCTQGKKRVEGGESKVCRDLRLSDFGKGEKRVTLRTLTRKKHPPKKQKKKKRTERRKQTTQK